MKTSLSLIFYLLFYLTQLVYRSKGVYLSLDDMDIIPEKVSLSDESVDNQTKSTFETSLEDFNRKEEAVYSEYVSNGSHPEYGRPEMPPWYPIPVVPYPEGWYPVPEPYQTTTSTTTSTTTAPPTTAPPTTAPPTTAPPTTAPPTTTTTTTTSTPRPEPDIIYWPIWRPIPGGKPIGVYLPNGYPRPPQSEYGPSGGPLGGQPQFVPPEGYPEYPPWYPSHEPTQTTKTSTSNSTPPTTAPPTTAPPTTAPPTTTTTTPTTTTTTTTTTTSTSTVLTYRPEPEGIYWPELPPILEGEKPTGVNLQNVYPLPPQRPESEYWPPVSHSQYDRPINYPEYSESERPHMYPQKSIFLEPQGWNPLP